MNKLILLLFAVLTLSAYSCTNSENSSSDGYGEMGKYAWTNLEYFYSEGSIPPQYFYRYTVRINDDGKSEFWFYPTAGDDPVYKYDFTITSDQINLLSKKLIESKIFDGQIPAMKQPPIGGAPESLKLVTVNPNPNLDQSPIFREIPAFPEAKYSEGVKSLYGTINGFIPPGDMKDAKRTKEELNK